MIRASRHLSRASQVAALFVLALVYSGHAWAQAANLYCTTGPGNWAPCSASNPLATGPSSALSGAANDTAVTVTNASAAAIASGSYHFAELMNQSSTDTIRCKWGGTPVSSDTAGQRTFLPYSGYVWDFNDPPPAGVALNCISSGASTPATVRFY